MCISTSFAGTTALHRASFNGGIEIADYLLQYQAYVSLQDQEGWTPLHLASVRGFLPLVKLLVEAGADVEAADLRGRAPIHAASIKGKEEPNIFLKMSNSAQHLAKTEQEPTPCSQLS